MYYLPLFFLNDILCLRSIIQEILDLSRLQSGSADMTREKFKASECFAETFDKYSTLCEFAQIAFNVSEDIPYVFNRFYSGTNSKGKESTGLGLAIARSITDSLKEQIWIQSTEGSGTSAYFTVTLA